jgi:hypothetical protein
MELFIRECHEKQKLVVHASAIPSMSLDEFRREASPIEQLHRYGMFNYVLDTIQGPDAILRYLCQTIRIHMLPIGNDVAMTHLEQITRDGRIRRFFVKNFFVRVRVQSASFRWLSLSLSLSTHYRSRTTPMNRRVRTFTFRRKSISPIASIINESNRSNTNKP